MEKEYVIDIKDRAIPFDKDIIQYKTKKGQICRSNQTFLLQK